MFSIKFAKLNPGVKVLVGVAAIAVAPKLIPDGKGSLVVTAVAAAANAAVPNKPDETRLVDVSASVMLLRGQAVVSLGA